MLILIALVGLAGSFCNDAPLRLPPRPAYAAQLSAPVVSATLPAVQNAGLIQQIQGATQYYTATHTLSPGSLPFGSYTGASGYTTYARTLVQFDLTSLPASATIQTATLLISTNDWPPTIGALGSIGVYRVATGWNESVTWISQPGTDLAPLATTQLQTGQTGPYRWDITGLAQIWQGSPATNHGVLLASAPSLGSVIAWAAASAVRGGPTAPALLVQYSLPATATPTPTAPPTSTPMDSSTPTGAPGSTNTPAGGTITPTSNAPPLPRTSVATSTAVVTPPAARTPTAVRTSTRRPTAAPAPTRPPSDGDEALPPELAAVPAELDLSRGGDLRCTFVVTGTGAHAVTDVSLELSLPPGVTLRDARFRPELSGWVRLVQDGRVAIVLGPAGRIGPGEVVAVDLLLGLDLAWEDTELTAYVSYYAGDQQMITKSVKIVLFSALRRDVVESPVYEATLAPIPSGNASERQHMPVRLPSTSGMDDNTLLLVVVSLMAFFVGLKIKS